MNDFEQHQGAPPTQFDGFIPLSWAIVNPVSDIPRETREIILLERQAPVEVSKDLALRAKVLDACGLTCNFCHNEGTPVAIDNPSGLIQLGDKPGKSGRVSVFSDKNGVDFLPGKMNPNDPEYTRCLVALKTVLGLNELHLTGGEPTLHPQLPDIVRVARENGYSVSMTSNGEKGALRIAESSLQGLSKINFSVFGTTPEELAEVQNVRYQDVDLARKKIESLHESIEVAANSGIKVSANIVMGNAGHTDRVLKIIEDFDPRLELRILPDLGDVSVSALAIYGLLAELGAKPLVAAIEAGSSNSRVRYVLPNGRLVTFKQIRPTRLETCNGCIYNNDTDCFEGFYGTRLYVDNKGTYKVGVCLQRMDLVQNVDDFIDSGMSKEILTLRDQEYNKMQNLYR